MGRVILFTEYSKGVAKAMTSKAEALLNEIRTKRREGQSGNININDDICKLAECEQLIRVDVKDALPQQRFVIAHELGHYLFEYIGSDYERDKLSYTSPYLKDNHNGNNERIANRFAAALLMPEDMFIREHDNAIYVDKRRAYVIRYLSLLFEVTEQSVIKRIREVGGV